ncbi:amino acid ABC transporter permease, partial [Pseudomonas sp. AB6]|nr:amino acid ABC transporter permease [Pseudomonas sp. AB6]
LFVVFPALEVVFVGCPLQWELPELNGFKFVGGWVMIPVLLALTIALTVFTAAFIGEIVRSGIKSVCLGQTEAGRSLG